MNCGRMRDRIQLHHSGELGALGRAYLRAHLRRCPECRTVAAELAALTRGARSAMPDRQLTRAEMEPILAAARVEIQRGAANRPVFPPTLSPWLKPLALAATILLLFHVAVYWQGRMKPADPDMAPMVPDDWSDGLSVELDVLDLELDRLMADLDFSDDLELMALELLQLEEQT